jgi:hypothetical protein
VTRRGAERRGRPGRRAALLALAAVAALLACAATALAVSSQVGNLKVSATAEFEPHGYPKGGTAPAEFESIVRIGTVNGEQPPVLNTLIFEFDKHGRLNAKGVPTCTVAKLEGTTPDLARKRCASALVGEGTGKARVAMPGMAPFTISSPISIFNGPPEGGMPTLIAHAYEKVPSPQALIVPLKIEKIHNGRYGFRTEVELPQIAGGAGAAILAEVHFGRTFERHGRKVGFVEAECVGGRLQVHGKLLFLGGDSFPSLLASSCHDE